MAARDAVNKSRDWVTLAEAIAGEDNTDIDIKIGSFIRDNIDAINSKALDDPEKAKIEDLLKRLETFTNFSSMLSSHFRQQLERTKS